MACLLALLALITPRLVIVVLAIFTRYLHQAYETALWPILGFLLLPLTTVAYVLVAPGGVTGYDWVWLIGAFLADVGLQGSSAYGNRQRVGMG